MTMTEWKTFRPEMPDWNTEITIRSGEDDCVIEKVFYGSESKKNVNNLKNINESVLFKDSLNNRKKLYWLN